MIRFCLKKTLTVFSVIMACAACAKAQQVQDLTVSLDMAKTDRENLIAFASKLHGKMAIRNLIFEFKDSRSISKSTEHTADGPSAAEEIYQKNFPNGDFYYLIGDLNDDWTKSDYSRYYSVAKWLAFRGFRTIINVVAYIPDLQEAASNPHTSAIIWNSHGAESGYVLDTGKAPLPKTIFTKFRSKRLKYILFANCYGDASAKYYGLRKLKDVTSMGWTGTVTSEDLFKYLFSDEFDNDLEKAIGHKLKIMPTDEIAI